MINCIPTKHKNKLTTSTIYRHPRQVVYMFVEDFSSCLEILT